MEGGRTMGRMRLVAAATVVSILGCSDAAGYGNGSYTDDYPDAGSGDIDCDQVDGPVAGRPSLRQHWRGLSPCADRTHRQA
jgi:hypothetical protein